MNKFREPLLCKGITLATFQSKGTVSLKIAVLKILVKNSAITGVTIRIILARILSIPVDLQGFKDRSNPTTLVTEITWNLKMFSVFVVSVK